MSDELLAQFRRVCTLSSYIAAKQDAVCDARKLGVNLEVLAKFKYILPDDIFFGYEDSPADTVFGAAPEYILTFHFNDKNSQKRKLEELPAVIKRRIARFEAALQQFISRRKSLDSLEELSKHLIPMIKPEEDPLGSQQTNSDKKVKEEQKSGDGGELNRSALFDQMCSELSNIVSQTTVLGREAKFGPVPPQLVDALGGIDHLWSHQSEGLTYLLESGNNHLVVSTPTASGKSLIFHSLVRNCLATSDEATAMFIYPTKALAQDQLRSFKTATPDNNVAFTFDGDTNYEIRKQAQSSARVLMVNPDILHTTILPNWSDWCRFLGSLRYVVIDELHYYDGVFGANVALVLRRLRRICEQLGAEPCQFIGCSATLKDPQYFMATLTGLPKTSILALTDKDDGSPSGNKRFVFCTPPFMSPEDPSSGRLHPIKESAPLMIKMVRQGMRVIAFCRYRRECELLLRAIYEADESLTSLIQGYRGGYSPEDRRRIEHLMFSGALRGIVATTALEVGIDVGNLDAAIISGFPHSIHSFRQQVGRVGRRQRDSLVVYVADGSVLNQAYATDPEKVIHGELSESPMVLHSPLVRSHIQAAAYEQALEPNELNQFFPPCENLAAANLIELDDGTLSFGYKPTINIRKAQDEEEGTLVIDTNTKKVIETVEFERVGFTLYDGAIFIHQGKPYLVTHLDPDFKYATVQRTSVTWTTRQRDYTDVDPCATDGTQKLFPGCLVNRGLIRVTRKVFGYFKMDDKNNKIIDSVEVQIPAHVSMKYGLHVNIPSGALDSLSQRDHHIPGSIHGAEHAVMSILPMFVSMVPGDVGTECKAPEKELYAKRETQRHRPARLIFYEKYSGQSGAGILLSAYRQFGAILVRACELVDNCSCEVGCGSCIGSGFCEERNAVLSKRGSQVILRSLLGRDLEGIPRGQEPNLPTQKITTVVPVSASMNYGENSVRRLV